MNSLSVCTILIACCMTPAAIAQSDSSLTAEVLQRQRDLDRLNSAKEDSTKVKAYLTPGEEDDPTFRASSAPVHQPRGEARKLARRAQRFSRKGRHGEAVGLFERAVSLDRQYYEAQNNLAIELKLTGRREEAIAVLRELAQANPERALAFANWGTLLYEAGRYSDAEAVARSGLKSHPYSFKTNLVLGVALFQQGKRDDETKRTLEYAATRYPMAEKLLAQFPMAQNALRK